MPTSPAEGKLLFFVKPSDIAGSSLVGGVGTVGEDNLDRELSELAEEWTRDTAALSSITEKATHPAYQQIIGIGPRAVPFLLRQLGERPGHWFWALKSITRQDPVPAEARGRTQAMADAWLAWGRKRELI